MADEIRQAAGGLDADAVWLLLLDDTRQTLCTAAARGGDPGGIARHARVAVDATAPLAEAVRSGRRDVVVAPVAAAGHDDPLHDVMPHAGSVALLPLTARSEPFGIMGIGLAPERMLTGEDREYLAALGGVSALALAPATR